MALRNVVAHADQAGHSHQVRRGGLLTLPDPGRQADARLHTVAQIAAEFGVTRPTIYRHLAKLPAAADS